MISIPLRGGCFGLKQSVEPADREDKFSYLSGKFIENSERRLQRYTIGGFCVSYAMNSEHN